MLIAQSSPPLAASASAFLRAASRMRSLEGSNSRFSSAGDIFHRPISLSQSGWSTKNSGMRIDDLNKATINKLGLRRGKTHTNQAFSISAAANPSPDTLLDPGTHAWLNFVQVPSSTIITPTAPAICTQKHLEKTNIQTRQILYERTWAALALCTNVTPPRCTTASLFCRSFAFIKTPFPSGGSIHAAWAATFIFAFQWLPHAGIVSNFLPCMQRSKYLKQSRKNRPTSSMSVTVSAWLCTTRVLFAGFHDPSGGRGKLGVPGGKAYIWIGRYLVWSIPSKQSIRTSAVCPDIDTISPSFPLTHGVCENTL